MATIQERIAALNQSHVGRAPAVSPPIEIKPDLPGPRPAMSDRYIPPASNTRAPLIAVRDQEILPPPTITRTGQKTPKIATPLDKPKKAPPPLPTRKISGQLSPALPPRRSSDSSNRRNSGDSFLSATSISTNSTVSVGNGKAPSIKSNSSEQSTSRKLAPAWGDSALPPLPPKRNGTTNGNQTLRPPPSLEALDPQRKSSSSSVRSLPPKLPLRSNSSNANGVPEIPPRKSPKQELYDPPQLPQRKLPTPVLSSSDLGKIKKSSFSNLRNDRSINREPASNGCQHDGKANDLPPPVPLGSRPDLSKIQATKPRMPASPPATTSSTTVCMECRDFSGPDNHAARFPRQSLPTTDLSWLANQLTAPFPSHTDKARAIFTWLHHNIGYNVDAFFNNNIKSSTPESTVSSGVAVCDGYASLFERLATLAGLEARKITGHGKGYGYEHLTPGSPLPPFEGNHAWNAVRIDNGHWKLIDACWGAGDVQGKGLPYTKNFKPRDFTMPNDEFGIKHFPTNPRDFYRDDGRPSISWEEYILINPSMPDGVEPPIIYTGVTNQHAIGEKSLQPRSKKVSICQPGPLRFQFGLICEHWTLARSNIQTPYLFILSANGVDGRNNEYIPFHYVRGSGPGGGGDLWYADVPDPRILGAPGQKLHIYYVRSFGNMQDTRGLGWEEFLRGVGRVAMGFGGIAEWELV